MTRDLDMSDVLADAAADPTLDRPCEEGTSCTDPACPLQHEIDTLAALVREVSNQRTGGYDVEFNIKPNLDKSRVSPGADRFFLLVEIRDCEPGTRIDGEWWFWDDNTVMQVL